MSDDDHRGHDKDHHEHSSLGPTHAPGSFGPRFAIGTALNVGYVIVQVILGITAHSLALAADAGHNLSDVLGLVVAWWASHLTKQPATDQRTYGMRRSSILAALANAIFILVAVGGISWEGIRRFGDKQAVAGGTEIWGAAIG